MKNKLLLSFSALVLSLSVVLPVAAQTVIPTGTTTGGASARGAQRITNVKTRAEEEIDRRIAALNKLLTRLGNIKKLTADQIASFTTQIQAEITSLTALRAKIDADTDLATLLTDRKSIVSSYRVYVVFMPQIGLLAAADRMDTVALQMSSISAKLQTRIQTAQTNGKNVTALQAALTDLQSKLADEKVQTAAVVTEVVPLTPAGYPGNKTVILDARSKIKAGEADLKASRQDIKTIILGLRSFNTKLTVSGAPSGTSAGSLTGTPPQPGS